MHAPIPSASRTAGLLESGCTDFLRVGPLRRISRGLLRQSVHCRCAAVGQQGVGGLGRAS